MAPPEWDLLESEPDRSRLSAGSKSLPWGKLLADPWLEVVERVKLLLLRKGDGECEDDPPLCLETLAANLLCNDSHSSAIWEKIYYSGNSGYYSGNSGYYSGNSNAHLFVKFCLLLKEL